MARSEQRKAADKVVNEAIQASAWLRRLAFVYGDPKLKPLCTAVEHLIAVEQNLPPAVYDTAKGTQASKDAKARALVNRKSLRSDIYWHILSHGPCSDADLELTMRRKHESVSSARFSLTEVGLLKEVGVLNGHTMWEAVQVP